LARPLSLPPAGPGSNVFTEPRTARQKLPAPLPQFRGPSALPAGTVTNMRRVCLTRLRSRFRVHPSCGFSRHLLCSRIPDCRAHGLSHLRGLSFRPAGFPSRAPVLHAVSSRLPGPRLQGLAGRESFTCPASISSQWTGTCPPGVNLLEFSPRPEHHALPRSCPPAVIGPISKS
jgi:hypothetical protein